MAYETYTTEAIVCGRIVRGEHDLTLRLYTKNAGMIFARAGAARALESKLRYGLQDFSYSTISLVRGKHEWRVIGATLIENFYYATPSREHRAALRTSLRSVRRFLTGAEAEPRLFDQVLEGVRALAHNDPGQEAQSLFLLRMLYRLGYVAHEDPYTPLAEAHSLHDAQAAYSALEGEKGAILRTIEHAVTVSHL